MLEAACAAALAALGTSAGDSMGALTDVGIPSPLILADGATPQLLCASVDAKTGAISIESAPDTRSKMWQAHLRASCSRVLPVTASLPANPANRLAALLPAAYAQKTLWNTCASLASEACTQPGEYHLHPATVDNCTQVEALNLKVRSTSSNSIEMHVANCCPSREERM